MARRATLQEIETYWSIDDVAEGNEALDAWLEAKATASERT